MKKQAGFTAFEAMALSILLVIAVAAVYIAFFKEQPGSKVLKAADAQFDAAHDPETSRMIAARSDITNLKTILKLFKMDNGRYPTAAEGLQIIATKPADASPKWRPYLDKLIDDPWGRPYQYTVAGDQADVFSLGRDGIAGNGDDVRE